MRKFSQHRGFSVLMALGVTAVLLIVVTGLAVMYAREFKLSRLSYDEILVQASAEGMFEYGMLKIRNHADGFEDAVDSSLSNPEDKDAEMFKLLTPRSEGLEMKYKIESQTGSYTTDIKQNEFLVIPLFVAEGELFIKNSINNSMKPLKNDKIKQVSDVFVSGLNDKVYWTIVALNDQESVALQGTGDNFIEGRIDMRAYYCTYIDSSDNVKHFESDVPCLDNQTDPEAGNYQSAKEDKREELLYSYEIKDVSVSNFLSNDGKKKDFPINNTGQNVTIERKNPYLIIYNNSNSDLTNVEVKADSQFTLPRYTLTATATKGDASQIFRFSEDKGAVYDALKYGYYDPSE